MSAFGHTPDGRPVSLYTLSSDTLTVQITDYGARILTVCGHGRDFICGPKTPEALMADTCYCGAICGRVANRIAKGQFSLDGVRHQLAVNNGPNHLHGGLEGFSHKLWTVQEADDEKLILTYTSPDGEENYPGRVEIVATYRLDGSTLSLTMEAYTDTPTIVNLTNHAYWNLAGDGTIDNHTLEVRATAYTPVDSTNIPLGSVLPVEGTPFDLRHPALLGERNSAQYPETAHGFDHNYALASEDAMQVAAVLICPAVHRKLVVATDAPGMQVYTGEYLPAPRAGIALEAQGYPNAVNVPHFPSVILRPGSTARRTIAWTIA
ncbi:aldose epimerase family protein [Akkermansia glycaniphila]|uniref:Aldose 1-epimerase n=1 Tax=Akkermansia glycaniphila TaxID=1679444 RepID=A0A1C7PEF4_9BACT|nr:aldose epimerase family protein [Akkermansia glycaniphila]OCA03960.1 hypothetical protein AC781_01485 [Akkermansia glycaniphila]SEH71292.1 aldose 1-epimerase [Akkermansia glycaniphila]